MLRKVVLALLVSQAFARPGPDRVDVDFDKFLQTIEESNSGSLSSSADVLEVAPSATNIPKIVHFVFIQTPESAPFSVIPFLAVKSALDIIKPVKILLWCNKEPEGDLWEEVKPLLEVRRVDLVGSVYGHKIRKTAHMADVIRLMALYQYGGIYLDLDVLVTKSFEDLLHHDVVMGLQGKDQPRGLCNAVILSKPRSEFLKAWITTYKTFNGKKWSDHSIVMPLTLSKKHPDLIYVLAYDAFFWPLWDTRGLENMFFRKEYDYSNAYAAHTWGDVSRRYILKNVTAETVKEIDNSVFCFFRKYLISGHDKAADLNCSVVTETKLPRHIVSAYDFLSDTRNKVVDVSGNHLNGWALGGELESSKSNVHRLFNDTHVAILPAIASQTLDEVTVYAKFYIFGSCEDKNVLISLQQEKGKSLSLSVNCVKDKSGNSIHSLELTFEKQVIPLGEEEYTLNFDHEEWHHIAMTISASAEKVQLYVDGNLFTDAAWPPANIKIDNQRLKLIWLGNLPPTKLNEIRTIDGGLKGFFDDLLIAQEAFSADDILKLSEEGMHDFLAGLEWPTTLDSPLEVNSEAPDSQTFEDPIKAPEIDFENTETPIDGQLGVARADGQNIPEKDETENIDLRDTDSLEKTVSEAEPVWEQEEESIYVPESSTEEPQLAIHTLALSKMPDRADLIKMIAIPLAFVKLYVFLKIWRQKNASRTRSLAYFFAFLVVNFLVAFYII